MKTNTKFLTASIMAIALGAASSVQAAVYTLPDFTRAAGGGSVSTSFLFAAPTDWTGTPPSVISGQTALYLTATVSWQASANIGNFSATFIPSANLNANRAGIGTVGSGFGTTGGQSYAATDPDGAGPATAAPTVTAVDKTTTTSVTLVIKIDQIKASPGGDWWFTNTNEQDGAGIFVWIDPNLGNTEASQPTEIAYWRSGQNNLAGVRFTSDSNPVDLNFSNIAVYTADDTPFFIPEPSAALLGGLGFLALLRRRRNA